MTCLATPMSSRPVAKSDGLTIDISYVLPLWDLLGHSKFEDTFAMDSWKSPLGMGTLHAIPTSLLAVVAITATVRVLFHFLKAEILIKHRLWHMEGG